MALSVHSSVIPSRFKEYKAFLIGYDLFFLIIKKLAGLIKTLRGREFPDNYVTGRNCNQNLACFKTVLRVIYTFKTKYVLIYIRHVL